MTRQEILNMTKEELNEAVARKVMGWKLSLDGECWGTEDELLRDKSDWNPAKEIEHAWWVILKMVENGGAPALINDDNGHWALAFDGMQNVPMGDEPCDIDTCFFVEKDMWHEEPGVAICRAALMAVEGE